MLARAAVALVLLSGCNPDADQPPPSADARPRDAGVDPSMLAIYEVSPVTIREGTGAAGGRPAVLLLQGRSFVAGATVTAELLGEAAGAATVTGYAASVDGGLAGIAVRIGVLPMVDEGPLLTLRLTVRQGDAIATADVNVAPLDELILAGPTMVAPTNPRTYSQITVSGAVHFTGAAPLRLYATAGITISAKLDGNAVADVPGPYGCAGGAGGAPAPCEEGGGGAGMGAVGGGGGGGFGTPGVAGDANGGAPGQPMGRASLVPLISLPVMNRGNGGGGGAGGVLGGKGGGGGGTVVLAAGGDITVTGLGAIEAKGGQGGNGTGGGGGGSGGAILVRSGGTITAPGTWLSAPGGSGGNGTAGNGGMGGVGRIRIDAAAGDVAFMAATPVPFRGPAWSTANPSVLDGAVPLTLLGEPGRQFHLLLHYDDIAIIAQAGADGRATVTDLPFQRGPNALCAQVDSPFTEESIACLDLFHSGR